MKIAVAANGTTLDSLVAKRLEKCTHLLIVTMEDLSLEIFRNDCAGNGITLAQIINEKDCEAVITGVIPQAPFEELAEKQVTRYCGADYTVKEALKLMESCRLDLIRNYEGEDTSFHMHRHGSCDCSDG
jgi:predicted Fe-Mo cluster-binding NifX family protein